MKNLITFLVVILMVTMESICGSVYLKTEKEDILISPKGKKIGEINNSAPIEVLEKIGNLLKIQVTGWIRKNAVDLGMEPASNNILELVSFHKKLVGGDYDLILEKYLKNILFKLKFKNNHEKTIIDWEAVLEIRDAFGNNIFNIRLRSGSADMAPGRTQELNLELERKDFKNKEDFDKLALSKKKNLKLELTEIKIKTK